MRYLCIDLGDKRTGLALGDSITGVAAPLDVLEVPIGDPLLAALARAIGEQLGAGAGEIVMGLPLNMDGTEGARAKLVREFATRLTAHLSTARPIRFQDERLSTAAADWDMAQSGLTRGQKKARRDALAAAAILREFLSTLGGQTSSP